MTMAKPRLADRLERGCNGGHCPLAKGRAALRWTGAAMQEAAKGFRRLKAHKQLPVLQAALAALQGQNASDTGLAPNAVAA